MRKSIIVGIIGLTLLFVVAGCAQKQQAYAGNSVYNPQGNPQAPQGQQVPASGGCGVIAPNTIENAIETVVEDTAL